MNHGKGRMVVAALAVALLFLVGLSGMRGRGEGPKGIRSSGMAGSLHPSGTRGSGEGLKGVAFDASNGLELMVRSGGLSWPSVVQDRRIIGPVCQASNGGLIVAMHYDCMASDSLGGQSFGPCSLWWIDLSDLQRYGAGDGWLMPHIESDVPFTEVRDMASSEQAVWVGTDKGMLRVSNRKAELFEPGIYPSRPSHMPQFPRGWRDGVTELGVDADGWVWVVPVLCVFSSDQVDTDQRAYSLGSASFWPMGTSASPSDPGIWVVTLKETGESVVVHLKPVSQPTEPEAQVPFHPINSDVLGRAPELGVSRVRLEADPKGRLWIAGQNQTGVHIFVCQEDALQEQTGFEKLLGGIQINDIAAGDNGKVYFATDGAGVLVFDGQQWQGHPINEHLPHLMGSDLKPVNYVLPLVDGRLAICTGQYLLIWNEGK